jgi:hypothetical protein
MSKNINNTVQISELKLFQCSFADPPELEGHYSVQFVGSIKTNFTGVSDNIIDSKWNPRLGRTVHRYSYKLEIYFRSQEGALKLRSVAYGKERGTTKIVCD